MSITADHSFLVQGSAAEPYELNAYGLGIAFRMFCSCAMGRRGGKICKHISALLMGEVGAVVSGAEHVTEVVKRAFGSQTLRDAYNHKPAKPAFETVALDADFSAGMSVALGTIINQIRSTGWVVEADANMVGLYRLSKLGKRLKHPEISLACTEGDQRPFVVSGRAVDGRSFGHLDRAAAYFVKVVDGNPSRR